MRCWTGGFDPLDSKGTGRVNLLDIIMQLGRTPRFGRAGNMEWTVLHHSVFVTLIYMKLCAENFFSFRSAQIGRDGGDRPPGGEAHALTHDFPEAYVGDIPRPVKMQSQDGYTAIKGAERDYEVCIFNFLKMSDPFPEVKDAIKTCDYVALVIEARCSGRLVPLVGVTFRKSGFQRSRKPYYL